jgi:hypothetical protein
VQTIPDVVYKVEAEGRFTYLNDAIRRYGYHQGARHGIDRGKEPSGSVAGVG